MLKCVVLKKAASNHNLLSDEIVKKAHLLGGIMENRFDPELNGKHTHALSLVARRAVSKAAAKSSFNAALI